MTAKDTQFAVNLLFECATGETNFAEYYLNLVVGGFIKSFEEHVVPTDEMYHKNKDLKGKVTEWSKSIFPPGMVEDHILDRIYGIGAEHLSQVNAEALVDIKELVSKVVKKSRMLTVLNRVVKLIK